MPWTTKVTSSGIPLVAAAVRIGAVAVGAVGLVDEDDGGLLRTGRTVKGMSWRDTERADHCERRMGC